MPLAQADDFRLPAPGMIVHLSPEFNPSILKGIKVHPDSPFRFDFIMDIGDDVSLRGASLVTKQSLKEQSTKLIKYFLASLTIPEKDLWVNLSPYEKDRVIPQSFGLTEMGRDLLAEDYMLKQITASLIYPEDEIGKKFWKRVYEEAAKRYGTTEVPVNTFNKVWIIPEKAVVYENAKAGTAYVVESKLKVMLEQDYLSLEKHEGTQSTVAQSKNTSQLGSQIVREIVIPELIKEVNEGKNFAQLRQVYNSLILATWYKKKIKDSILARIYGNKNKVAGVDIDDPQEKEKIYQRYLTAFKRGCFNYIKEDIDPSTLETMPRKYFSGGLGFIPQNLDAAMVFTEILPVSRISEMSETVSINVKSVDQTSFPNIYSHVQDRAQSVTRSKRMQLFWAGEIDLADITDVLRSNAIRGKFNGGFRFGNGYQPGEIAIGIGEGTDKDRIFLRREHPMNNGIDDEVVFERHSRDGKIISHQIWVRKAEEYEQKGKK